MDAAEAEDRAEVLKACHALTQTATAYAKLVEVGELEERFAELEKELETLKQNTGLRKVA